MLRKLLLFGALSLFSVVGPRAALGSELRLVCHVAGEWRPIASVDGKQIFVGIDGKTTPAPEQAEWRLEGDLRGNVRYVLWSPAYSIRRLSEQPLDSTQRAGALVSGVSISQNPFLKRAGWRKSWDPTPSKPTVVVFAWLVGARATRVEVDPVPAMGAEGLFSRRAKFTLDPDEESGQPVLLAWSEGAWVQAQPRFAAPNLERALEEMMLDGRVQFQELGKAVNQANDDGLTLLHLAAEAGLADAVDGLIKAGAKANVTLKGDRATPLEWAATKGRIEAVRRLIKARAAQRALGDDGQTPLNAAVEKGHLAVVRVLLGSGSSAEEGRNHRPPLGSAIDSNYPEIAEYLAEFDPTFDFHNVQLERVLLTKVNEGRIETVKFLLRQGVWPSREARGLTPLLAACNWNSTELISALLQGGAKVNQAGANGLTPLMVAARRGNADVVKTLLMAGANVNAKTESGVTSLHLGAMSGDEGVIEALLSAGADVHARDQSNETPLDVALQFAQRSAALKLVGHGAKIDLKGPETEARVEQAIVIDAADVLQQALDEGWSAQTKLRGEWTMLQVAKVCGAERTAALLRQKGATEDNAYKMVGPRELDAAPKPLSMVSPNDPRQDFGREFSPATVELDLIIDGQGRVLFPRVRSGDRRLAVEALSAVSQWKFAPLTSKGQPAAARFILPVQFRGAEEVFDTQELDVAPKPLKRVLPIYPFAARKAGVVGEVQVEFVISTDGSVEDARVSRSSEPAFEEPAVAAVKQWKFSPAQREGKPVRTKMAVPIVFQLND